MLLEKYWPGLYIPAALLVLITLAVNPARPAVTVMVWIVAVWLSVLFLDMLFDMVSMLADALAPRCPFWEIAALETVVTAGVPALFVSLATGDTPTSTGTDITVMVAAGLAGCVFYRAARHFKKRGA